MAELYWVSIFDLLRLPKGMRLELYETGVIDTQILIMGFYRVCATDDLIGDRVGYGGFKR